MIKYGFNIKTIHDTKLEHKKVLVRVDFDISLNAKHKIANDTRLLKALPTIQELLKEKNKLILVSKLGRPKEREESLSLKPIGIDLQKHFPSYKVILVADFLSKEGQLQLSQQTENEIILLENIRFYKEEKENSAIFAKKLADLAEVFVLDAFAMAHRKEASVTGVTHFLPSFAGLELENEVNAIEKAIQEPKKPVVAIMGGAKIPDKLQFLAKLIEVADYLLVGGGIANTFLYASGYEVGKSICEKQEKAHVEKLFALAKHHKTEIVLPSDVTGLDGTEQKTLPVNHVTKDFGILDIGPETEATFGGIITSAKTIIWNGPVGYFEKEPFNHGTDFIYYSIAQNPKAYSLIGGGDTLAAVTKKEHLENISHISTGGGAMLEFIENGTLPGLEALKQK